MRRSGSLGAVLVVAAVLTVATPGPPPASAHEDPTIAVRLTEVSPALPAGVDLTVQDTEQAAAYLFLANDTATATLALEPDGTPFLQVSADGVFGNVDSTYLATARGAGTDTEGVRLACCPTGRWLRLSDSGVWAWRDPRLDPPELRPQAPGAPGGNRGLAGLTGDKPLATWSVDLRHGGQTFTARGVLEPRELFFVRPTVDSSPGTLSVTVIESRPPRLRLEIPAGSTVLVLDRDGAPFIRMRPQGTEGRADNPQYLAHRRASGLPPKVDAGGWLPWAGASPTTVSWADDRLVTGTGSPPGAPIGPGETLRWSIPVTVDGKPGEIRGTSIRELAPIAPPPDSVGNKSLLGRSASVVIAILLTAGLAVVYLLARRKSAATPPPDTRVVTLLALVAVLTLGGCGGSNEGRSGPVTPEDVLQTVKLTYTEDASGQDVQRFPVDKGKIVNVLVTSDTTGKVTMPGYNLSQPVTPAEPALLIFDANMAGRFDVVLESAEGAFPIATLDVR